MRRLSPAKRRSLDALLKAFYDAIAAEDHASLDDVVRGLK
jgi:hypothetical protein